MRLPTISDSRGNKSTTLFLVVLAFFAMLGKFIASSFGIGTEPSLTEFGLAVSGILAPWIAREGLAKLAEREEVR